MAYSEDYRKRVIEYRKEGHTFAQTHATFKVAISTIERWDNQLDKEGSRLKIKGEDALNAHF